MSTIEVKTHKVYNVHSLTMEEDIVYPINELLEKTKGEVTFIYTVPPERGAGGYHWVVCIKGYHS